MTAPVFVPFDDGIAICGAFPDAAIVGHIREHCGPLPLTIADPPFGNIVDATEYWDRINVDDSQFCEWMIAWTKHIEALSLPGAALYVWGGVGKPRDPSAKVKRERRTEPFRPFFRYMIEVERQTGFNMATPITWRKRRAYGIQWSYLFTREECAYLVLGDVRKPRRFEVPLTAKLRGYAGYDAGHPAKSPFLRVTNVWDDITELLRGKEQVAQKPQALFERIIRAHTEPDEWVFVPFCGTGTAAKAARALGRRFVVVEKDERQFERMISSLGSSASG